MTKKVKRQSKKRIHIISRKDGWAIKRQGASKASKKYANKEVAVKSAQKYRKEGHDVIIHKKDGSIAKWEKPIK